jgi:hypothetical protein
VPDLVGLRDRALISVMTYAFGRISAVLGMRVDWLVTGHVVAVNPATSVRGPKHVVRRGKTTVLTVDEARTLLDSIPIASPPISRRCRPASRSRPSSSTWPPFAYCSDVFIEVMLEIMVRRHLVALAAFFVQAYPPALALRVVVLARQPASAMPGSLLSSVRPLAAQGY